MSFNTALTAGNYNSLRGTSSASPSHRARICLSLCPNANVYTARVNQTTFGGSFAQIAYDSGAGTLANVRVGMTVLVSHASDRAKAFFMGRVRKTPTASVLYVNETSAPFANDDYIFVLDDYRIHDTLTRRSGGVNYPDYDQGFRQLLPRISNLKSAYAGTTVSGILTQAFAPAVAAATDGATISTYLWEVDDGTITVGSSATKDITATFPPGFRWIHFTATDDGGRPMVRHIPVWSHDDTYPVTLLDHGDLSVTGSLEDGYSGSVSAWDGIDTVLDNTLVAAWLDNERYNETATHIFDNIALVGRLRREDSQTDYADAQMDAETQLDIEGPLQQLARLEITSLQIDNDASPTAFNQVNKLTLWREIHLILTEYTTFSELHSVSFDDVTDNFREPHIATQAGNILSVVNALANGIGAAIQLNAAGEAEVVRNGVMIPTASRTGLVTVASWDKQDLLSLSLGHSHVRTVGRLDATGGSYKTTSGKVTTAQSIVPGIAPEYPDGTARLDNQVLASNQGLAAAETELNIRAGHALAKAQEADELTITHPDSYWWLTPSANQWYTFTLDGSETSREVVLTTATRWQLVSISVAHEVATGTRSVEAIYRRETSGAPGQRVRYPPQSTAPLTLPVFPALPAFPIFDIGPFFLPPELPTPDIVPGHLSGTMSPALLHDGNTLVMVTSGNQAFMCPDFLKKLTPSWREITPELEDGETLISACRFVPGSPVGALLVSYPATTVTYDFVDSPGGWVICLNPGSTPQGLIGQYVSGTGWQSEQSEDPGQPTDEAVHITLPLGSFTQIDVYATVTDLGTPNNAITLATVTGGVAAGLGAFPTSAGANHVTYSTPTSGFDHIIVGINQSNGDAPQHNCTITKIEIQSSGTRVWRTSDINQPANWIVGNDAPAACTVMRIGETYDDLFLYDPGNNDVYYSDDRGATWSAAISAGTTAGAVAGFDTGRLGTVTLAAADVKVRIATTQGGAYGDYTSVPTDTIATAIFIPRYKFSQANNGIGVSAPDFIFASAIPAAGTGYGLFKVTASGATVTNITALDGATKGLAVGPNCLAMPWYVTGYQDILAILNFGGTRKLAISDDAGSTWTLSGALHATSDAITTRRSDILHKQLFMANGPNMIYSSDYRAAVPILAARIGPTDDNAIALDVLP